MLYCRNSISEVNFFVVNEASESEARLDETEIAICYERLFLKKCLISLRSYCLNKKLCFSSRSDLYGSAVNSWAAKYPPH